MQDKNNQSVPFLSHAMIEPITILFLIAIYYALKIWMELVAFSIIGAAVLAAIYASTDHDGDLP